MKLAEAQVMRGLDACAINDYGIPGIVLMENAGRGTVEAMLKRYGALRGKLIAILVGPGNNGGDGLVVARYLHQIGARPQVFLLTSPEKLSGDAAVNLQIVKRLPMEIKQVVDQGSLGSITASLQHSTLLVDAIFGTGLSREVGGHFAAAIVLMNQIGRPIVAVDMPSGLNSDSGQIMGVCVQADLTVTYGLAKPGQVTYPGAEQVGSLKVVDIGIPPEAVAQAEIKIDLLQKDDLAGLVPQRLADSHKGTFGHVMLLGGSQGKTGAAMLGAKGALRAGAGLVTLGSPQKINDIYEASLAEAMTVPLVSEYCLSIDDYDDIAMLLSGKKAVVLGPGLGLAEETRRLVSKLYQEVELAMVVDADALNALSREKGLVNHTPAPRIMTPHPGEMARMTGLSTSEIQANRREVAASFAKDNNVILVLKGAATIIADPHGRLAVNPTGNSGMAAGGMGDVLSGVLGGLLAQGLPVWEAACLGVYVHGLAADRIAAKVRAGFLASEVADEIPLALQDLIIK